MICHKNRPGAPHSAAVLAATWHRHDEAPARPDALRGDSGPLCGRVLRAGATRPAFRAFEAPGRVKRATCSGVIYGRYVMSSLTKTVVVLFCVAVVGCAPKPVVRYPPLPSVLPPTMDIDKLLPKAKPVKVDLTKICKPGAKYKPINVRADQYKDSDGRNVKLPGGVLISDCQFAKENILARAKLKRVAAELRVYKEMRKQELAYIKKAEGAYHKRIKELTKPRKKSVWDRIKFGLGLVLGAGVTLGLTYGTGQVVKQSVK